MLWMIHSMSPEEIQPIREQSIMQEAFAVKLLICSVTRNQTSFTHLSPEIFLVFHHNVQQEIIFKETIPFSNTQAHTTYAHLPGFFSIATAPSLRRCMLQVPVSSSSGMSFDESSGWNSTAKHFISGKLRHQYVQSARGYASSLEIRLEHAWVEHWARIF
jgi:hypothetical protein